MGENDKWGPGERLEQFDTILMGNGDRPRVLPLCFGENPHSRQDNNMYVPLREEQEAVGFNGHRPCVKVVLGEYNYLKESEISGDEVRKGAHGQIFFDGKLVYGMTFREVERALPTIPHTIALLREHPINFRAGDGEQFPELVGRKVYYRDTPCTVESYIPDQGCVILVPPDGVELVPPAWSVDREDDMDYYEPGDRYIKDDVLSHSIHWFREKLWPGEVK